MPSEESSASVGSSASHPSLIKVVHEPGEYSSYAVSLVSLPAGTHFTPIKGVTKAPTNAYSSVQISPTEHIELNSDLLYVNHSCAPSLEFDMEKMEVRVSRTRDLKEGDRLTFFYPSTEWEMAQPFQCLCGEPDCCGWIDGARNMSDEKLSRYWLNGFIKRMHQEGRSTNGERGTQATATYY